MSSRRGSRPTPRPTRATAVSAPPRWATSGRSRSSALRLWQWAVRGPRRPRSRPSPNTGATGSEAAKKLTGNRTTPTGPAAVAAPSSGRASRRSDPAASTGGLLEGLVAWAANLVASPIWCPQPRWTGRRPLPRRCQATCRPTSGKALTNGAAGRLELTVSDGRLALFADGRSAVHCRQISICTPSTAFVVAD